MARLPHDTCGVCGWYRALRQNGTFREHTRWVRAVGRSSKELCAGSGLTPEASRALKDGES